MKDLTWKTVYDWGSVYSGTAPPIIWREQITQKPEGVSTPLPPPGSPRSVTSWVRKKVSRNTGTLTSCFEVPGSFKQYRSGYGYNTSFPELRPWNWAMRGRAINGALANLKDQKIDLSVAFLERKQTAELFSTNISRVADLYGDLKRGKRGVWDYMKNFRVDRGSSRVSQVPKAWLEVQYAVKPLLSDVHGALQKLNKLERSPNAYFFVTKKSFEENDSGIRHFSGNHLGPNPLFFDYREQDRAHCSLVYRLANPLTRELANLGITNPLSSLYEALLFSFVLDWAIPVGDYLNALDADFGWEFVTGSVSLSQRSSGRGSHFQPVDPHYTIVQGDVRELQFNNFAMFREVFETSPWPVYPTLKNPLSSPTRVTSALALLQQVFR